MASTTATVETLTAEVRVLMVGSRQVTLSVARQLDWCDLSEMEPFGRVRIGDSTSLIGKHRETGVLVNAILEKRASTPSICAEDLNRDGITVCNTLYSKYLAVIQGYFFCDFNRRKIKIETGCISKCTNRNHGGVLSREDCGINFNGNDDEIMDIIGACDEEFESHRLAASLPLIVLAGLR